MEEIAVYCADVGSIKSGNFGWARRTDGDNPNEMDGGDDIGALADRVAEDLKERRKIALGFECPLYVPVRDEPKDLTSQREEEKGAGRPWSAGAGAAVLGVGLVEAVYVLDEVRGEVSDSIEAYLDPDPFRSSEGPSLLLWEAMVTGDEKSDSEEDEHTEDARIAVEEFLDTYPDFELTERDKREGVHSLIGSTLLRTKWMLDPDVLSRPCVFIKPGPSP